MKKLLFLSVLLLVTIGANAQLKVYPNKRVLIGEGPNPPVHTFETYLGTMAMNYTNRPMWFNIASSDPRIQTTTGGKIVFYNTANSGYIDIQVKAVLTTSDAKFKTNITPIGDKGALTTVQQLKGVEFNFKDEADDKKHAGFIAQDLEKVLPHLVATDDSVGNKAIDYQAIIPYLVEAIKEQQIQIDQLKQKLSTSSTENDTDSTREERLAGEAIRDDKRLIHLANSQE